MDGYKTLKKYIFICEGLMGVLLIWLAWQSARTADIACHSFFNQIPSMILLIMGIVCLMFGLDAMLLRDDPDVWR